MKVKILWMLALTGAIAIAAPAQISVYIGAPPPPIPYVVPPPAPYPGYIWTEGYWAPQGNHYRWVPGAWVNPPYGDAEWNHPHWDHYDKGWRFHEGHWDHGHGNAYGHDNGHGHGDEHGNGHGNGHDH